MLLIRDAQVEALAEATFERSVAEHLRQHFPDRCADLGAGGALAFAREAIAKARRCDLSHPANLVQFACLMLVLGHDFDVDPRLPWAGRILRDPSIPHLGTRMSLLCDEASRRLDGEGGDP